MSNEYFNEEYLESDAISLDYDHSNNEKSSYEHETQIIQSISFVDFTHKNTPFMAYEIKTSTNRTILIGISSNSQCCELYNIMFLNNEGVLSEGQFDDLIGCELTSVNFETELICDISWTEMSSNQFNAMNEMQKAFVNIVIDQTNYQIFAYNDHNGYYTHNIIFRWDDVDEIQEI